MLDEARPDLPEEVRAAIAPQIGIGAVKYADLSVAHDSEYVFDLDRMVSLTGNTGPYLQYAAARVRSIFRNAGLDPTTEGAGGERRRVVVRDAGERDLALALVEYGSVVAQVGDALEPHRLAAYLFDLAQAFSTFYEHHPVLKAEDSELRESRLALCALDPRGAGRGPRPARGRRPRADVARGSAGPRGHAERSREGRRRRRAGSGTVRSMTSGVIRVAGPLTESPSLVGASGTATATQRTPCSCSSSSMA